MLKYDDRCITYEGEVGDWCVEFTCDGDSGKFMKISWDGDPGCGEAKFTEIMEEFEESVDCWGDYTGAFEELAEEKGWS